MRKAMLVAALCAVTAAALGACGPHSSPKSASSSGPGSTATASNGWEVAASASGNTVTVAVTVTGPATIETGCVPPVEVTLSNSDGSTVPTPKPGMRCTALSLIPLPPHVTKKFTATASAPHSGTYIVHTTINSTSSHIALPDVFVQV